MRLISASWVVTGDGETPPLRDGALVLDDSERIVALGPVDELRRAHAPVVIEHHQAVLLPGLVNAHTHLELSELRGKVPGGRGFVPWVDALVSLRAEQRGQTGLEAIDDAVSELLSSGVMAIGEVTNGLSAVPALREAPVCVRLFHEVFGVRKETGAAMLAMARKQGSELGRLPPHVSYTLAPHTPYTMHPDILREIVRGAQAAGMRTSLHLAEHSAERAYLGTGAGPFADWIKARNSTPPDWATPGTDPVAYVASLGALGPHVIAVHLTDARASELAQVAEAKSPVVFCPRSNLHIELKLPPLLDALRVGLRPGLGTDSLASCPSLDPLAEARALHQRFSSVAPRVLLAMATAFGADALGYGHLLGRLRPGLHPGVLAFDHGGHVPADPERFVLQNDKAPRRVLSRPSYHRLSAEVFA